MFIRISGCRHHEASKMRFSHYSQLTVNDRSADKQSDVNLVLSSAASAPPQSPVSGERERSAVEHSSLRFESIRFDLLCNRFQSIRFVKKSASDSLVVMQFFLAYLLYYFQLPFTV